MIAAMSSPAWQSRGPRFLVLIILAWVAMRVAVVGMGALPVDPDGAGRQNAHWASASIAPLAMPMIPEQVPMTGIAAVPLRHDHAGKAGVGHADAAPVLVLPTLTARPNDAPQDSVAPGFWSKAARHQWRLGLVAHMLGAVRSGRTAAALPGQAMRFPPGQSALPVPPVWPVPSAGRWSLSAYAMWRPGSKGAAALAANRAPTLGGSQLGVRVDYRLDRKGHVHAFVRGTAAPGPGKAVDGAVGLAVRPWSAVPAELYVEQRVGVSGDTRDRTLIYAAGGVDDLPLRQGFTLSAYGQGGMAGLSAPEAFADGLISVQRPVVHDHALRLSVGAMAAGAVQRNAARVDIGPRATLYLPRIGEGAQLALDWRQQVAGNARPNSGVAVTLAAGF